MQIPWILISVAGLIIILGILAIILIKHRKKPYPTDYKAFFIMGVIWTIFGIIFYKEMFFFLIMGIGFMVIGLVNKDKWEKNKRSFKNMDKFERKIIIWATIILALILIAGIAVFMILNNQINYPSINNFKDCVDAGFPVMESFPRQCSDGIKTFVEEIT